MERTPIELEKLHPDVGKRLFDVKNPERYLTQEIQDLQQRIFCENCKEDYEFGERKIETDTTTCCPTKRGEVSCDGSMEELQVVKDKRHLALLRRRTDPPPF